MPQIVLKKLRLLKQELNFDYAAIDLLEKQNNTFVFLEANYTGDWNYFDNMSEKPMIRRIFSEYISKQFTQSLDEDYT